MAAKNEVSAVSPGRGSFAISVYDKLRAAIEDGTLKPGDRMVEVELAETLGVSRTPVREAITLLENDGLITNEAGRGRAVAQLDYQALMELYAIRETLEGTAAALAARNAADMEIQALKEMLEFERGIFSEPDRVARHNRKFHEAVCFGSHNRYFIRTLGSLQVFMVLMGRATRTGPDRAKSAWLEHKEIVDAIAERNPARAEEAVRAHIRSAQLSRIKKMLEDEH